MSLLDAVPELAEALARYAGIPARTFGNGRLAQALNVLGKRFKFSEA